MKIHVVKKGEDTQSISRRYGLEEKMLLHINGLKVPGPLCPGQSLFIPGDRPEGSRAFEVCAFSALAPSPGAAQALTYLCLYSHRFDSSGLLIPPSAECSPASLRAEGCAPLLCLANFDREGGFSPELAHLLFTSPEMKNRLFDTLLSKLKTNSYYGLQLCFNYLFPFDRDNYSAFIAELSEILHREALSLFIELAPPDSPSLSAALDYTALGKAADRLSLMFCRWGHSYSPPQPIAPLSYIRAALDTVTDCISPGKLLLGISGCGFDWKLPWRQGDKAIMLSNSLAAEKAMAMGLEIKYDSRAQAPFYDCVDAAARRRRVYFEDARSIATKLELIEQYSLAGLSLYSFESSLSQGHGFLQQLYSAEKLL